MVRKQATMTEDGQITVAGLPYRKGDQVNITFSKPKGRRRRGMTAGELLRSPMAGMWADRKDIGDSSEFARRLREQAQIRRGRK